MRSLNVILVALATVPSVAAAAFSRAVATSSSRAKARMRGSSFPNDECQRRHDGDDENDDEDRPKDDVYAELDRRIESLSIVEAATAVEFEAGIRRRMRDVAAADAAESEILMIEGGSMRRRRRRRFARLPAVTLEPLLPGQRFEGMTSDPKLASFLREMGLGGLFVVTSLNRRQRKVRRSGVVARIASVDADAVGGARAAVRFALVGRRPCRIVGPARDMVARVGRMRKSYDPDGEEPALGWGDERFTDSVFGGAVLAADDEDTAAVDILQKGDWPTTEVCITLDDGDDEAQVDAKIVAGATSLLPLLDRWLSLASDPSTYENSNVVVSERVRSGSVDPSRLIRSVLDDLGDRPPPTRPTALIFWGAALINPPLLGVSPEVCGAVLEAANVDRRLRALERGLVRSIHNLEGTSPLCS